MTNAPKFLHIRRPSRSGFGFTSRVALCGRLVNVMAMRDEDEATCPKCIAESLTRVQPAEVK